MDIYNSATHGEKSDWEQIPEGILALIIILDQFPRNMFRETKKAYDTDVMARELCKKAIALGFDQEISPERRDFVYMPLMHSENIDDQNLSIKVFGKENPWAKEHRDIILEFGRFPYMNKALGRISTLEEEIFLQKHSGF